MASNRSRAAKVELQVGTGRARTDLKNFAKDAKRKLGDIGAGSYHGKGIFQSRGAMWRDRAGRAGRSMGRGAMAAGGALAGGALGVAAIGGLGLASVADDVYGVEKALTRFEIATDKTPEQMAAFREELTRVSKNSALSRDELLKGASAYVALTGDAAGAAAGMATFAKVSNATGASMDDIAATAAAMKDNLKIDPKDFEAAFSALHVQGKAGAVELRELATELAGIAPSFSNFKGGGGVEGLVEMGAALQVIRKGFGSSSQAATGMQSLMVSLQRNAKKFQKAGVKIYDKDPKTGKKRLKDFSDIIDAIAKKNFDPTKLIDLFGRDEAARAYDQIVKNRALMNQLIREGGNKGAIDRDAERYLTSDAGRIETAWNRAKLAMAEAFTPERIEAVVRIVERMVAGLDRVTQLLHGLTISEQEHRENQDFLANRERGVDKVQAAHFAKTGTMPDRAAAEMQYRTEEAQFSNLRQGASDWRSPSNMLEQIARVQGGAFGRGEEFERLLAQKVAEGVARGLTPGWMGGGRSTEVTVKVGADPVARASAQAPAHRTRAGGV